MQLTGKQIVNQNIIGGVCPEGVQQQGVDVRVMDIKRVDTHNDTIVGYIPAKGKTHLPIQKDVELCQDGLFWELMPGYYEVTFEESCKIPANCAMYFKTRSSLVRCGAEIRSGQFDGGFETEKMGAFLKVELPIRIDVGARVAQAIVTETYPVDAENLYNGQWQNDKQRQ
jgi:deoxycytidine triphosphate deaminase